MSIDQIAHAFGEVSRGSLVCYLHMTPGIVHVEQYAQIGCAITPIFAIVTLGLTRCHRDRLAYLADQLGRAFIKTNHRPLWIGFLGMEIEDILLPGDVGAVHLWNAPHVPTPGLQVVLGQPPAHRLARQTFMLRQPDNRAGQQVQGAAPAALGRMGARRRHQQRRLLARQFARRSGARLLAQSELQVAFHEATFRPISRGAANRDTVRDHVVADSGIGGQQDLRPFEFTRRMLPAAQWRRELCSFCLAQFHPVAYVHRMSPVVEGNDESSRR